MRKQLDTILALSQGITLPHRRPASLGAIYRTFRVHARPRRSRVGSTWRERHDLRVRAFVRLCTRARARVCRVRGRVCMCVRVYARARPSRSLSDTLCLPTPLAYNANARSYKTQ